MQVAYIAQQSSFIRGHVLLGCLLLVTSDLSSTHFTPILANLGPTDQSIHCPATDRFRPKLHSVSFVADLLYNMLYNKPTTSCTTQVHKKIASLCNKSRAGAACCRTCCRTSPGWSQLVEFGLYTVAQQWHLLGVYTAERHLSSVSHPCTQTETDCKGHNQEIPTGCIQLPPNGPNQKHKLLFLNIISITHSCNKR